MAESFCMSLAVLRSTHESSHSLNTKQESCTHIGKRKRVPHLSGEEEEEEEEEG
jgi:hypothetical protein